MMHKARLLMCRPDHFGVSYSINPWMDPKAWASEAAALTAESQRQWKAFHRTLKELGATIDLVPAVPKLPDLVFTANAAVVMDGKALVARFRHVERQGEEVHYLRAFQKLAAAHVIDTVETLPPGIRLEGAGDCVWDPVRKHFWMGYGPRSDIAALNCVEDSFGLEAVALELANPRFYHMDTALCPLSGGEVMYVPHAFTSDGLAEIRARIEPERRIELSHEDAALLAANAVNLDRAIVLSACGDGLRRRLAERGYAVHQSPLDAFGKSGGSAFCLTLRLDHRSKVGAHAAAERAPALVLL
jgi:N-dimethylarginine dimethylaminohydrolase